jgi:hypothetical protein
MKSLVGYNWSDGHTKQVAYIGPDHHIHEFYVVVEGMWQQEDLMALVEAPPAGNRFLVGYEWPEGGTKQVAYLGQDEHVHELCVGVEGSWQHTDLNYITGAPPANQVTAGYSWSAGHSKQVLFVGDDDHIHELVVEAGKPWRHVDLTAITNAPLPGSNFMVGYEWSEGQSKQVAYIGLDGHIHELSLLAGGLWQHLDLSAIAGAPRAVDIMGGFEWPGGECKQVAFVSEDLHIHELVLAAGGAWQHADLNIITGAPDAMDVLAGYAWLEGHSKQIVYAGQDGRIHELSVEAGGAWQHADLTELSQAPITPITCIDGYAWSAGNSKQVTYTGDDGVIRELWMPRGGGWVYTDLSIMVMALPARF